MADTYKKITEDILGKQIEFCEITRIQVVDKKEKQELINEKKRLRDKLDAKLAEIDEMLKVFD